MCYVKGYVTAIYEPAWWVACVTVTDPEMQEVTLSFLHPRGSSRSFVYPHKADILTVHISDILTFVMHKWDVCAHTYSTHFLI